MVSAEYTDLFLNDESMKAGFFEEYPSSLNIEIEEFLFLLRKIMKYIKE